MQQELFDQTLHILRRVNTGDLGIGIGDELRRVSRAWKRLDRRQRDKWEDGIRSQRGGNNFYEIGGADTRYPRIGDAFLALVDLGVATERLCETLRGCLARWSGRPTPDETFRYVEPPEFAVPERTECDAAIWREHRAQIPPECWPRVKSYDALSEAYYIWRRSIERAQRVVEAAHEELDAGEPSPFFRPSHSLLKTLSNLRGTMPAIGFPGPGPEDCNQDHLEQLRIAQEQVIRWRDELRTMAHQKLPPAVPASKAEDAKIPVQTTPDAPGMALASRSEAGQPAPVQSAGDAGSGTVRQRDHGGDQDGQSQPSEAARMLTATAGQPGAHGDIPSETPVIGVTFRSTGWIRKATANGLDKDVLAKMVERGELPKLKNGNRRVFDVRLLAQKRPAYAQVLLDALAEKR